MFEGGSERKEWKKDREKEGGQEEGRGKENECKNWRGLREVLQACLPQEEFSTQQQKTEEPIQS